MILIRQAQYRAPLAPTRLRYQKGNRVKGAILRHSRQGAKLQAARNKNNRGNSGISVLRGHAR